MINAKEELLGLLKGKARIKCAYITYGDEGDKDIEYFILKIEYTKDELNDFLDSLNFNYDNGYGGQELFGTIWLEDDTWCTREEYDGSEWWRHNKIPLIPMELYKF